MSLHRFSRPTVLPTPKQAGLPENVISKASKVVSGLSSEASSSSRPTKRNYTTTFTAECHASFSKYAAEQGTAPACKKFKASHGIGESTVMTFKKKYLEQLKQQQNQGMEFTEVKSCQRRSGVGKCCWEKSWMHK